VVAHELNTFPSGMWALQSMLGVECMPQSLRLAPYIPSGSAHIPVTEYPEYASLVRAGIVDESGHVHDAVSDWLTVVSRPDLEVQLVIRRPGLIEGTIRESVTVICRLECWLVGIGRRPGDPVEVAREIGFSGDPDSLPAEWVDRIRVFPVGAISDPVRQTEAITDALVAELGEFEPADIDGVNLRLDTFLRASGTAAGDPEAFTATLARQGVSGRVLSVLSEVMSLDRSALAAVSARQVWAGSTPEERALRRTVSVADCTLGRVSMSQSVAQDGTWWLSVWPGHSSTVRADVAELVGEVVTAPARAQ
jgi:hypothetical protein